MKQSIIFSSVQNATNKRGNYSGLLIYLFRRNGIPPNGACTSLPGITRAGSLGIISALINSRVRGSRLYILSKHPFEMRQRYNSTLYPKKNVIEINIPMNIGRKQKCVCLLLRTSLVRWFQQIVDCGDRIKCE